jgi:hypothetical protein
VSASTKNTEDKNKELHAFLCFALSLYFPLPRPMHWVSLRLSLFFPTTNNTGHILTKKDPLAILFFFWLHHQVR